MIPFYFILKIQDKSYFFSRFPIITSSMIQDRSYFMLPFYSLSWFQMLNIYGSGENSSHGSRFSLYIVTLGKIGSGGASSHGSWCSLYIVTIGQVDSGKTSSHGSRCSLLLLQVRLDLEKLVLIDPGAHYTQLLQVRLILEELLLIDQDTHYCNFDYGWIWRNQFS